MIHVNTVSSGYRLLPVSFPFVVSYPDKELDLCHVPSCLQPTRLPTKRYRSKGTDMNHVPPFLNYQLISCKAPSICMYHSRYSMYRSTTSSAVIVNQEEYLWPVEVIACVVIRPCTAILCFLLRQEHPLHTDVHVHAHLEEETRVAYAQTVLCHPLLSANTSRRLQTFMNNYYRLQCR